jgi:hypothetical protein
MLPNFQKFSCAAFITQGACAAVLLGGCYFQSNGRVTHPSGSEDSKFLELVPLENQASSQLATTGAKLRGARAGGAKSSGANSASIRVSDVQSDVNSSESAVMTDREAIQNAINQAVWSNVKTTIVLEPRVYNLDCVNLPNNYCLTIYGSSSLTISGTPGKTKLLVNAPRAGVLHANGANGLTITGIDIDYKTAPFTQGVIKEVGYNYLDYQVSEDYLEPSDPLFVDDVFGVPGSQRLGFIFAPGSTVLKDMGTASRGSLWIAQLPQALGNRTWRIWTAEEGLTRIVSVGDRFVFGPRSSYGMFFLSCNDLTVKQVSLFTSPFIGSVVGGSTGHVTFDQYRVAIPLGSDRLISTVADGIHGQNNSAAFTIMNSHLSNMGDDFLNLYATGRTVYSVAGNKMQLYRPDNVVLEYAVGDFIQITDPQKTTTRLGPGGEAKITSVGVSPDQKWVYLEFDRDVSAARYGDSAFNLNHGARNSLVYNTEFGTSRGMIRLHSAGTVVYGNRFYDAENAKILFGIDPEFNEGPIVTPPLSYGNSVSGGGSLVFLDVGLTPSSYKQLVFNNSDRSQLPLYDVGFYRAANLDIAWYSDDQLYQHWLNYGMNEGRRASPFFFVDEYRRMYPDLQFMSNRDLMNHYETHGRNEGRAGRYILHPLVFNPSAYRLLNPDIASLTKTDDDARYHWIIYGLNENRASNIDYSTVEYLALYSDLYQIAVSSGGAGLAEHFVVFGKNEGRTARYGFAAGIFDYPHYVSVHADLFYADETFARAHWISNGMTEGRQGSARFWSQVYMQKNSDLWTSEFAAKGWAGYVEHYARFGFFEGRVGR